MGNGLKDEQILAVLQDMEALRRRRSDLYNLPREAAHFLHILAKAAGIKNALEVGTSNGYSGIWLAWALKETGGHLTTIEASPEKVAMAQKNFAQTGLADIITIVLGAAERILPKLPGPFDFVLFDADKSPQMGYLKTIFPKLAPGAILVSDNINTHPYELGEYLSHVRNHPDLDSITVPLGNGLEVSYNRKT